MPLLRTVAVTASMISIAAGCGLLTREPPPKPAPLHADVSVEVENHNWNDITIYLLTGGLPQRVGMVTALTTASFALPSHRLHTAGSVRLRALPVAGQPFTSEDILVQPGQAIMWTLESDLDRSSVAVY